MSQIKQQAKKCLSQAYTINSQVIDAMKKETVTLKYGTAKFRGKHFKDNVCLDSLGNRCVKNFEFLALFEAEGLSNEFDGILGLANHKQESNNHMNFVKQL